MANIEYPPRLYWQGGYSTVQKIQLCVITENHPLSAGCGLIRTIFLLKATKKEPIYVTLILISLAFSGLYLDRTIFSTPFL